MFRLLVLFFVFFLPFQFALRPQEGVDLASVRVLAIVIFLWWSIRSLTKRQVWLPKAQELFFFSAFLFIAAVSFLWAGNDSWALRKSAFLLSFFPLFLVFSDIFRDFPTREKIFRALGYGSALAALFALLQFSFQFLFGVEQVFSFWVRDVLPFFLGPAFGASVANYPSLLVNISGVTLMRASGFFPDPHMAAFFFGMTFPLALSFALRYRDGRRIRWALLSAIILLADLLTFSRGGYIGLIAGMGVFSVPLLFSSSLGKKKLLAMGAGSAVALLLILASPVGVRLLSSVSLSDGSNTERVRLWQESFEAISERPVLGVGLGNYPLFVRPDAQYRDPIYVHNLFLDIAVEMGIAGLIFFLGLLGGSMLSAWRHYRKDKSVFHLALVSSLTVFSMHALFETPLFSVQILPLLLLVLAGSFSSPKAEESSPRYH